MVTCQAHRTARGGAVSRPPLVRNAADRGPRRRRGRWARRWPTARRRGAAASPPSTSPGAPTPRARRADDRARETGHLRLSRRRETSTTCTSRAPSRRARACTPGAAAGRLAGRVHLQRGRHVSVCLRCARAMTGSVVVEAPRRTPTPTPTPPPRPRPARPRARPRADGARHRARPPTPTETTLTVKLAPKQKGTRVRGSVDVRAGRLQARGDADRRSARRACASAACSSRRPRAAPSRFSVALDAKARRTLRAKRRLVVTVVVALTPPGGKKLTRSVKATSRPVSIEGVRRLVLLLAAGLALGACGETPRPATEPRVKLKLDAARRRRLDPRRPRRGPRHRHARRRRGARRGRGRARSAPASSRPRSRCSRAAT